jgi:hypothetical protein
MDGNSSHPFINVYLCKHTTLEEPKLEDPNDANNVPIHQFEMQRYDLGRHKNLKPLHCEKDIRLLSEYRL